MIGVVKYYGGKNPNIGYIINSEDDQEYRVHRTQIRVCAHISRLGKNILETGDWVKFELTKSPTGDLVATNVELILDEKKHQARKESTTPNT